MRRVTLALILSICSTGQAQTPAAAPSAPPPPPATKLEGFKPTAGSVSTVGYTNLGRLRGISVDVREISDAHGHIVRGLVVEVRQSEYREERSFVDADEIPELIKGIDALLAVASNPTSFENFEVSYKTKGELEVTAFNNSRKEIQYAVTAGRALEARQFIDQPELQRLRGFFQEAAEKIGGLK